MENVIIYNKKPIYVSSEKDGVDWWLVLKALIINVKNQNVIIESLNDKDFDDYMSKHIVRNKTVNQWLTEYGVTHWKFSKLINDYIIY